MCGSKGASTVASAPAPAPAPAADPVAATDSNTMAASDAATVRSNKGASGLRIDLNVGGSGLNIPK